MNYVVDDIGTVVAMLRGLDKIKYNLPLYGQPMLDYLDAQGATDANIALMPFYDYGHRREIAQRLTEKDSADAPFKYQKYPLIALRLDTEEDHSDGVIRYNLNLAIIASTEVTYSAGQRYEKVFKPVLYPIYEQFLKALGDSGLFWWDANRDEPPHTKVDRLFWGTAGAEGNESKIFNDNLDAIEILNLRINQSIKC